MHKTIWMILMLLLPLTSLAQTAEERAEQMKANAEYICGEGWGDTYNSADQAALADLISKISLNISNSFEIKEEEFNTNSSFDSKTAITSVMNSYAQATLTNTFNLVISNTPQTHVLRYIRKSEVNKIFDERKEKVFDYVRSAMRAEEKAKIDDALRNYYWAFAMVRSLQYPNSVKMTIDGVQRLLVTWIPQQIEEIMSNLSTKIASKDGNEINLFIKYKGEPVTSLDYTYFDGQTWSNLYSAKDGMGIVELRPGVEINSLQLKYEYEYADQCQIDKELESVMQLFKGTSFKNASVYINNLDKKSAVSSEAKKEFEKSVKTESAANLETLSKVENEKELAGIMTRVINAIKAKDYDSVSDCFSEDGLEMYKKLLNYGQARLLGDPQFSFYTMGKRVVCRSIPMAFSFKNNRRKFVEDVTFTFDENKKIDVKEAYRAKQGAEKQSTEKQGVENLGVENLEVESLVVENVRQLNTKEANTDKSNTDKSNTNNKKKEGTRSSYDEIINDYTENEELRSALVEFVKMRKMMKKPLTNRALSLLLTSKKGLNGLASTDAEKIDIVNQTIMHSWQGFFPLKDDGSKPAPQRQEKTEEEIQEDEAWMKNIIVC